MYSVMVLAPAAAQVHHFLQGQDIGVDLPQDFHDALRADAAIHPSGLVDVVGRYAYTMPVARHAYCCRSSSQPKLSVMRSANGRCRHSS
jgi:hypothetical protein